MVSAKTGEGIADVLRAVEADLPRPGVAFEALLPYERGDLLNRIHVSGEVESLEHTGEGTRGRAVVRTRTSPASSSRTWSRPPTPDPPPPGPGLPIRRLPGPGCGRSRRACPVVADPGTV